MSTSYIYCGMVILHNLSEKLSSCQCWDTSINSSFKFRIIRVDCGCVYNKVNVTCDIVSRLWIRDYTSVLL